VGKNVYLTQRADNGKDGKAQEQVATKDRDTNETVATGGKKDAKYLDQAVQARGKFKVQGGQLDAANGFAGGAPAAANAKAGEQNIGQGNVSTLQSFQGSRLLNYGGCNFNCPGDELVCSDPRTGKSLWSVKLEGDLEKEGGFLGSPPAAAGGQIFLATLKGEVLQVDPSKGKINKTYKVGSPIRFQPAIDSGRIYVGTQGGKVVCINTGNPEFTGWSTWGGTDAAIRELQEALPAARITPVRPPFTM
jgi:outer membrane protein assembly factor BamB